MLHDLPVLRDLNLTMRDNGPGDFGHHTPPAKAKHKNGRGDAADQNRFAGREQAGHLIGGRGGNGGFDLGFGLGIGGCKGG